MPRKSNVTLFNTTQYIFFAAVILCFACGKGQKPAEKAAPAKVANAVEESSLATVTLTAKAEERLGIEVEAVERKHLPGSQELGGEIMAVPGSEISVSSPVAGTVLRSSQGNIPAAGKFVKRGEEIMRLLMLPPEKDLLSAREDVAVKQEQLEVAQAKADRAEQLLKSRALSEKRFEEIQSELTMAKAAMRTAKARQDLLNGADVEAASENLTTLVLHSPVDGVLQGVMVAPGQTVPAATVLFDVARVDPVWIRVPVYVGHVSKFDLTTEAVIQILGTKSDPTFLKAEPIQGPPLSDAASASADLYFKMANPDKLLRIGQKVKVLIQEISSQESLVLPWSSILYDINGGNWVYAKTAAHVYSRRRVEVSHIVGEYAVVTRGVAVGDEVVVAGAAEIFGTEFGVGK